MENLKNLYREEAVSAVRQDKHGGVIKAPRTPRGIKLGLSFFLGLCGIAFPFIVEIPNRIAVEGVLTYDRGLITVASTSAGLIASIRVTDGERIRKGMPIYQLAAESGSSLGQAARTTKLASLRAKRVELLRQKESVAETEKLSREELQANLNLVRDQATSLKRQIEVESARQNSFERYLAQLNETELKGFINPQYKRATEQDILSLKSTLEGLKRSFSEVAAKEQSLKSAHQRLAIDTMNQRRKVEFDLLEIDVEEAETLPAQFLDITSPEDGTIASTLVKVGEHTVPGGATALLVPDGAVLIGVANSNAAALGSIEIDDKVVLRLRAFPYETFGVLYGRVAFVRLRNEPKPSSPSESAYEIGILLNPIAQGAIRAETLRAGFQFDADIVGHKVRLINLILSPATGLLKRS